MKPGGLRGGASGKAEGKLDCNVLLFGETVSGGKGGGENGEGNMEGNKGGAPGVYCGTLLKGFSPGTVGGTRKCQSKC